MIQYRDDRLWRVETLTKGLNEVANCHRQLGCRDGYTLARNIASIEGLQDCYGCEDDDNSGFLCHSNYDHNSLKFKYRMRLKKRLSYRFR